jgi:hypothetical protein
MDTVAPPQTLDLERPKRQGHTYQLSHAGLADAPNRGLEG